MAAPLKDKLQVFAFGLLLGLVIGVGFFVFKLDSYFRELGEQRQRNKLMAETPKLDEQDKVKTKIVYKEVPVEKKERKEEQVGTESDSLETDSVNVDLGLETLATDSLNTDSIDDNGYEEIVVKKDEKIAEFVMKVYTLKDTAKTEISSDSLISSLSGMNQQESSNFNYNVEYWVSPLNYKGYRLAKNKLILYGVDKDEPIRLISLDKNLFIRRGEKLYRLRNAASFQHFEQVVDAKLLAKLESVK